MQNKKQKKDQISVESAIVPATDYNQPHKTDVEKYVEETIGKFDCSQYLNLFKEHKVLLHNRKEWVEPTEALLKDLLVETTISYSSLDEVDRYKEHFFVLGLSRRNRVLYMDVVSIGCHHATVVAPMEVFRRAVMHGATCIILSHNHPSENIQPSKIDILLTKKLREAGRILDIPVIDHIIFSICEEYFSFADQGML